MSTENLIHPTAIIDPSATLGNNVSVGAYSTVGANVTLGDNVTLKSHVCVEGNTVIGAGTVIYPFAAIGTAPQDLKFKGENSRLVVGKNCSIREHVTMHTGTADGGLETRTGDNCLFMVGVHLAHDCIIGNNVIMANNATLGGHVVVGNNVLIGGLSAVHQFIRIGDFAVIGGMSGVESDVIPYGRVKGERAFLAGLNLVGLERNGFNRSDVRLIQKAFTQLFSDEQTLDERIDDVSSAYSDNESVQKIIEFAKGKSRFPLCQPQKQKKAS
jgi:UDP-N-acetylglucosamine acyltransferase